MARHGDADALVDAIQFVPSAPGSLDKVEVIAPAQHWLTAAVLRPISWFGLRYCAEAVAQQHGFGVEESGFEYPTDREPDEAIFEGVRLHAFDAEVFVSTAAFDRLMLRYFDAMTAAAVARNITERSEPAWTVYLDAVAVVRARVAASA